jgi:hypothetical protein
MTQADDKRVVVQTPRGSSIEALEGGQYRVCTPEGQCQTVTGLHRANDLMYWKESQRVQAQPGG